MLCVRSGSSVCPKVWAHSVTVRSLLARNGSAFLLVLSRLMTVAKSFGPPCVKRTLPRSAGSNAGHCQFTIGTDTSDHWVWSLNHAPDSLMVAANRCGYFADNKLVK